MKLFKILKAIFSAKMPDIPVHCVDCGKHYADKYKDSLPVPKDDGRCWDCGRKFDKRI